MPECENSNNTNTFSCENPKWLTEGYMEEKLRTYYKDSCLKVLSMIVRSAIGKGENYSGVLTRTSIQYTTNGVREPKTGSYIIKSSLQYGDHASTIEPYDICNKEMNIYVNILPKLFALLEEIGDTEQIFPETIGVDYEHSSIIFEDLTERKFIMYDRLKGLDMEHTKMCLRKLAKMHASSVVLNERAPGTFATYDRGLFNRHTDNFGRYFVHALGACGELVSQWKGFEEYGKKLIALKSKVMEYATQAFDATDGHLNVFAHGDLWINNVMFNYNEKNKLNDVILLDFQYSCWGSPAIDFHYFFNTSLQEELRLHHQDELIQYYYSMLSETLKALGFQGRIPSLHKFNICIAEKRFYAVVSACLVQPLLTNEIPNDAGFDVIVGEDERSLNFKKSLFQNERIQRNLKTLLPYFDRKGLLDPLE